ncbi:glycosyltransferase family 39 protein [Candidatus Daviesbacteria bacterium]|nr:glycosyltransferase family 39 protein [Candidatus Daviesbacteria bacterium]
MKLVLFILVFLFTFILRTHNFDKVPGEGHLEEHLFGWAGIYLIEEGVPVSWSALDYPKKNQVYLGPKSLNGGPPIQSVTLYKPWLDEPPLYSLISGGAAHLYGADKNYLLPASYIRAPAIIFAALTSILIFLIAKILSGYWMGILSLLIYGVTPIFVFSSRLSVPENLIALLFTLAVYLIIKFNETKNIAYLLIVPLLAGLGGLAKPTGYFITFFAMYFAFAQKKPKLFFYLFLATIPFVIIFILYGFYFDKDIFLKIVSIQGSRPAGFSGLAFLLQTPAYDIFTFFDGWFVFCLLFSIYFLINPPEGLKKVVPFAFLYWVVIVLLSGGEQDLLPWYRYPIYPMMAIMGAWGIQVIFNKITFFKSVLLVGLLLATRYYLINPFRSGIPSNTFRVLFSLLTLPSLFYELYRKEFLEKICKIILVVVIVVGVYFNSIYIYNQFEIVCESLSCPIGPSTSLSTIHFPFIWRFFVLKP